MHLTREGDSGKAFVDPDAAQQLGLEIGDGVALDF